MPAVYVNDEFLNYVATFFDVTVPTSLAWLDLDGDGVVTILDANIWNQRYGQYVEIDTGTIWLVLASVLLGIGIGVGASVLMT